MKHVHYMVVEGLVDVVFAAVPEVFENRAIVGFVGFQLIYVDFGSKLLEIEAF